jgi:hypothetical protein
VPSLAGQPAASATAALRRAGLKWQRREETSDTIPPGRVVGTSPEAAAVVDKGATVILIVAAPVKVAVPQLVGQKAGEAAAMLAQAGLRSRRQERSSARAQAGTVIGTVPAAGQPADKGGTVTLIVAGKPVAAVPREPTVRAPSYPPSGTTAAVPWTQQSYTPPRVAAPAAPPAPAPAAPAPAPAAPAQGLSGNALLQHLLDNAHSSY